MAPGVAFIAKPFTPEALARKVKEMLPARTILIVDDEKGIVALLQQILSSAGYEVVSTSNGNEALEIVQQRDVDLVITDLVMPERDGIEVIQTIHRVRPELKIIAISGAFEGKLLRVSQMLGAGATLRKPINSDELLTMVCTLLD